MSLLFLALFVQSGGADKSLDLYRDLVASTPSFEVKFKVGRPGTDTADASMLVQRNKRIRLDAKWGESDYSFVTDASGVITELERASNHYDEVPNGGSLQPPKSGISGTPGFVYPWFILSPDIRKIYSSESKMEVLPPSEINGKPVVTVRYTTDSQMGPTYQEYSLDEQGNLLRVADFRERLENRAQAKVWDFQPFRPLGVADDAKFALSIPNGSIPHRLPDDPYPIAIGESFPHQGWKAGNTSFPTRWPALIAVLGEECTPSEESLKALAEIEKAGLRVLRLSDAKSASAAKGRYIDATGQSLAKLSLPATPYFAWIDKDGKIQNHWIGYDKAKQRAFVNEVQEAAKGSATQ